MHLPDSGDMSVPAQTCAPTQSAMQQEFGEICAQVLLRPIARMKMGKSFVAQGGDSLLAIKLMSRCREAGYDVSIAEILGAASLDELARIAESQKMPSAGEALTTPDAKAAPEPIEKPVSLLKDDAVLNQIKSIMEEPLEVIQDIWPCSRTQEVFLISQQANPEMYQCAVVAEIKSTETGIPLDYGRLLDAWNRIVEQYAALRTLFVESSQRLGHFDQVIMRHEAVPLKCHLSSDRDEEFAKEMILRRSVGSMEKGTTGRATIWKRSETCAVFRLDVSHALMDGQSFGILFRDFAKAYCQNELPAFTEFPYHKFATYQEQLNRETIHAYWANYLTGAQPTLFPTNGNRDFEDLKTLRFRFDLDAAAVHKICVEYNATAANLCQVAWALVLGSYAGSDDVCFSYVNSGRHAPLRGIEDAVGAFVDVMVCRVRLSGTATVSQTLSRAKHDVIEGLSRPGSLIFEDEKQGQKISELRGNTIMTFQMGVECESLARLGLEIVMLDEITASEYDISLNIQPCQGGLDIQLDYWLSRVDQHIIESVAESFQTALACLVTENDAPLRGVDVVSARQIEQMRKRNMYNSTEKGNLLHDLVDTQADVRPDALAVSGWDGELTYRHLSEKANKLASYLQRLGAQREMMICTCFEKSKWAAISQLAILQSGAAVVPLGTTQPMKRLETMIGDTGADMILTTSNFAGRFAALFQHVVVIDDALMAKLPPSAPSPCSATPASLAFVVYTSGSTGVPKGVMITHESMCISLRNSVERINIGPDTRMLQFSAYTFDAAIFDFFANWITGACACIVSEYDRLNRLVPAMCELNVNWACLTPTMAEMVSPEEVPSLKHLVLIGEAVKPGVVSRWIDHVELWNGYGPTECSIISSCKLLTRGCNTLNLGLPITGAFWVVDATNTDRLVPTGAIGELLIQGPHLARGYLNDQDKTSLAFITEPAWESKYAFPTSTRYYRTGDLVQQDPDGSVIFVGRRDTQVKLRGQRVDFAEIEQHLMDHDSVVDAAIVLAASGPCKGQLVALVTLEGFISRQLPPATLIPIEQEDMARAKLQTNILSDWLLDRVPEYMVPATWIPVTSRLLQTESGKLDRVGLGRCVNAVAANWLQEFESVGEEHAQELGATPLQLRIRDMWAEILSLPITRVPIDRRSFLSLGGDSITAMKAVSQARKQGITLTVPDILQSKSIAKLTEKLESTQGYMLDATVACRLFPLSPAQQWYFDWVFPIGSGSTPGSPLCYTRSICLQVNEQFDEKRVATSVSALVSMHPMLRARFLVDTANAWQQQVAAHHDDAYGFKVSHIQSLDEVNNLAESTEQEICIENGPVFSIHLMQLEADEESKQLLFITGHQLVMDETSTSIIVADLEKLLRQDDPTLLSVELPSFQAWILGMSELINEAAEPASVHQIPDVKSLVSTPSLESCGLTGTESASEVIVFEETDTQLLLSDANRALRTEPVELILAALTMSFTTAFPSQFVPALFENCQGRRLFRGSMDNSRTVGCFSTVMPLRLPAANIDNAVEILKETKDARRNLELGLHNRYNNHSKSADETPAVIRDTIKVLFSFDDSAHQIQQQSTLFSQQTLPGLKQSSLGAKIGRNFGINVDATILQDKLHVRFNFDRSKEYGKDAGRWPRHFHDSMRALFTNLEKTPSMLTLSDFPLIESTCQRLKALQDQVLPSLGLQPENVEDMYPCTPMQNGILMSQARLPWMYQTHMLWQLQSPDKHKSLSVERIMQAYQTLTNRHPMLRTVFVPRTSIAGNGAFDQIVIKQFTANVEYKICQEDDPAALLAAMTNSLAIDYGRSPNHKFRVYSNPSGLVYGHLVMNHALYDGFSLALMEKELTDAYEERLTSDIAAPPYSAYLSFLKRSGTRQDLQYWLGCLAEAEGCLTTHHCSAM